jgi:hypothetical protein
MSAFPRAACAIAANAKRAKKFMNHLQLQAGAAQIDITPQPGVQLAGSLLGVTSTHVQDPLRARAIVLEAGSTRIAFVLLDVILITNDDATRARELIGAASGVLPENVCISCTHNHSGPSMTDAFNTPRNAEYIAWMLPRAAEAARQATENLQPARAAWGIGQETQAAFNRRFHMQDGSVKMNPGICNPEIIRAAGPTDPQLPALLLSTRDGKPLAALTNFSLHYIGDQPGGAISADYFGAFAAEMQKRHGDDFVALLTHGFSGDINAIDVRGEEKLPHNEKSRRLAARLANEMDRLWRESKFHDEVFIGSTRAFLNIGVRKISGAQIEENKAIAADQTLSETERIYARERLALLDWPGEFPVEVQALRVGDFAAVAVTSQMFCRFGMDLKFASPFPVTTPIEHANGCSGYVATQTDYALGSYETELARSSFAASGSGEKIVTLGAQLLRELAREHPVQRRAFTNDLPA